MKTLLLLAVLGLPLATSALAASGPATRQCAGDCANDQDARPRLLSRVDMAMDAPVQQADARRMFEETRRKDSPRRKFTLPLRLPFGLIN